MKKSGESLSAVGRGIADETELLAPAGNFETALAAFEAGADAVYCGLSEFSARAFADNFSLEDLKNLLRYARGGQRSEVRGQRSEVRGQRSEVRGQTADRRVYVTFNTVIDEGNLETAVERLSQLDAVRPDALIVQDLGVARVCRKYFPDLELHASTQLVAHNLEGVLALKEIGFRRVVLARELSLAEIESIKKRCGDVELEVFIHGALCYSISGLCLYGAMEKGRSGNRGACPYCCRQCVHQPSPSPSPSSFTSFSYPFSMKDLRLGEDVKKLAQLGIASLKIEGRMKSPLYVASVTRYYRQMLGGGIRSEVGGIGSEVKGQRSDKGGFVSVADLETVFSRRTTELLFNSGGGRNAQLPTTNYQLPTTNCFFAGHEADVIDPTSLGHRGTPVGTVKRVTKDREGRAWLRFHTTRALEKHDGLQFDALTDEGRHFGFGIAEMRSAISRVPVFEVVAGADVEVLLPEVEKLPIREGDTVYCSMSNAVKRAFPTPSFRPSDYPGTIALDLTVTLKSDGITVDAAGGRSRKEVEVDIGGKVLNGAEDRGDDEKTAVVWQGRLEPAKSPEKTFAAIEKAFSKFGETDYRLGRLTLVDDEKLFAPASVLNDLRRDLVERLDEQREKARTARLDAALDALPEIPSPVDAASRRVVQESAHHCSPPPTFSTSDAAGRRVYEKTLKLRIGQTVPAGEWDEIVVSISPSEIADAANPPAPIAPSVRLALPVWNGELGFGRLRTCVKGLVRAGYVKWECSDLATLRLLRQLGVEDITADWSLYAFNSAALAELAERGVKRFVASPENGRENLAYLAESGYAVEFLVQQSTPLFISRHRPAAPTPGLAVYPRGDLWVTTKPVPRTFTPPNGVPTRVDLSWDAE